MILSNTCDIDISNIRMIPSRVIYTPIIKLESYKQLLIKSRKNESSIRSHLDDIRKQRISHIFYLPAGGSLKEEAFSLFDLISTYPADLIKKEDIPKRRIFTLSDYGFYLFLFKISIHFTRIREGVDRSQISCTNE